MFIFDYYDVDMSIFSPYQCEERCGGIEAQLESEEDEDVVVALSPGAGEWARARAVLAGAGRRAALLRAARAGARCAAAGGRRAARYYEESAEALCATVPRAACWARTFSHLFPENAYLALGWPLVTADITFKINYFKKLI